MTNKDICPLCGKNRVNGICVDCGGPEDLHETEEYESERHDSLEDVIPPKLDYMSEADELEAVKRREEQEQELLKRKEDNLNPYANVISYETPDYGDHYIEPETAEQARESSYIQPYGTYSPVKDQPEDELISKKIKLKPDKTWLNSWWIILIAIFVPYYITTAIGAALLKFDSKGGRQAGAIVMVIAVIKIIIVFAK